MNDLISREEARDLMYHNQEPLSEYDLDSLSSIEAEPVKHGHWIATGFYDFYHTKIYECSHCHNETASHVIKLYNRCPKCGAKMDESK